MQQSVSYLFVFVVVFLLKCSINSIPDNQNARVILIDAELVSPVVNLVMCGHIEEKVVNWSEAIDKLSMDPELIDKTHAFK